MPTTDAKKRALVCHFIYRLSVSGERPILTDDFFRSLVERALPTPAEAMQNLLLYAAPKAENQPGAVIHIDYDQHIYKSISGLVTSEDVNWCLETLINNGLLASVSGEISTTAHVQLTHFGWQHVEELRNSQISSKFAFFARKFNNPDLDNVFEQCLKPAVKATGYDLRTVTQKAGHIDAIIEDEIRRCRFLIADLSDENAGAYWEAGFAEGLGKPVIYVGFAEPGEFPKTHFDTSHRHLVTWHLSSLDETSRTLKAVIRNTLLGDAVQTD